ncbi:MAG TPA: SRPBCC domain-containing protein [Thermoanaerobaculia bacterium]
MNRPLRIPALVLGITSIAAAAFAADSSTSSVEYSHVRVTKTRAPLKRLDFEVVVPATVDAVWNAFTSDAGVTTWCAPKAKVRLELGGEWEVGFAGAAPGGGTILAWLPDEMLTIHAMAPENFPTVRRERTIAVFRFEPAGERQTRVRLAQFGWKDGEEWDRAYEYLAQGNAALLNMLYKRFAEGPLDWDAIFKKAKPESSPSKPGSGE